MTKIKMVFDPEVAKDVGTDAAIILSNIEFWQATNQANKRNFHDDRYWTYNSTKAFTELFSYLSDRKIRTCLDKLEAKNYITAGNYNKSKYDRTKWYSANVYHHSSISSNGADEIDKWICQNSQMDSSKLSNGIDANDEPIPDNKQQIVNTNKKTDNKLRNFDFYFSVLENGGTVGYTEITDELKQQLLESGIADEDDEFLYQKLHF
jgi:hypothetical protein